MPRKRLTRGQFLGLVKQLIASQGSATMAADYLGIAPSTVYRWLAGSVKPSFENEFTLVEWHDRLLV